MYINKKKKSVKKVIRYLMFTLILIIFLNGCTEDPIDYCKKNNCLYCEKDSDCTADYFFEETICCQELYVTKNQALNVKAFNKIAELKSRWYRWHCFFKECKGSIPAPLPLPKVQCVNNICTPFSPGPAEICISNICEWNISWKVEQEELFKKKAGL